MRELFKFVTYRTPVLNRLVMPKYAGKIPGQLTALVNSISRTREEGGAIVEIGVAKGDTSVFLWNTYEAQGMAEEFISSIRLTVSQPTALTLN